jgi:hypothetical protein
MQTASKTKNKNQTVDASGKDSGQLINVRMEDLVDEADRGRFVRVCIWELDVDFPLTTCERR